MKQYWNDSKSVKVCPECARRNPASRLLTLVLYRWSAASVRHRPQSIRPPSPSSRVRSRRCEGLEQTLEGKAGGGTLCLGQ